MRNLRSHSHDPSTIHHNEFRQFHHHQPLLFARLIDLTRSQIFRATLRFSHFTIASQALQRGSCNRNLSSPTSIGAFATESRARIEVTLSRAAGRDSQHLQAHLSARLLPRVVGTVLLSGGILQLETHRRDYVLQLRCLRCHSLQICVPLLLAVRRSSSRPACAHILFRYRL
jgi:hypothetical protein